MSISEETASICKRRIESLEIWLRRLIHDKLSEAYGPNFLEAKDDQDNPIIKREVIDHIKNTYNKDPNDYARLIDATMLPDAIAITCRPDLYKEYFKGALSGAFDDDGNLHSPALLKNFLTRLVEPRNKLSHARPISERQAERVLCITGDVIESIKKYYRDNGMEQDYNCPLILSFTDHRGKKRYRDSLMSYTNGGKGFNFKNHPEYNLHPGDTISIAVDVDSAFDGEYKTTYAIGGYSGNDFHQRFEVAITEGDIGQNYSIGIKVININPTKQWARIGGQIDDQLRLEYKVLPLR